MWYQDMQRGLIIPASQLNEDLEKDFIFNYGQTVLVWNIFVTAAHGCVQCKNEMNGMSEDELKKAWEKWRDKRILSQFVKKFRPGLKREFKTLLNKRHELMHQPIKDMNRLLAEAGLSDSHPISDEDMLSLLEKQKCFKDEVQSYTNIVMDVFKSVQPKYKKWKSGIVR